MIKKSNDIKIVTRRRGTLPKKKARAKDGYGPSKQLPSERPIEHPAADTDPPAWMCPVARGKWEELATVLSKQGLLTVVDRDQLALYCEFFSEFVACSTIIAKGGIEDNIPVIRLKNAAADRMMRQALEFGLTPAARSRVTIDEHDSEDESITEIFGV